MVDVRDDVLLLSDVAVQPVHPTRPGSHHIHPGLCRLLNDYTGTAMQKKDQKRVVSSVTGLQTPKWHPFAVVEWNLNAEHISPKKFSCFWPYFHIA